MSIGMPAALLAAVLAFHPAGAQEIPPDTPVELTPDMRLVEEVRVDANNPDGASTLQALVPGESYIFETTGTVAWGLGQADAECATFDVDPVYLPARFASVHPHLLDVLVDGQGVEWVPTDPDVNGCNTDDHTYRHWMRATSAQRVNFRFHESPGYYPDNQGAFTVRVFFAEGVPPDGTLVDQFSVPANSSGGANSTVSLSPAKRYRLAVSGVYNVQSGPELRHDAECLQVVGLKVLDAEVASPYSRQDELDDAGEMKDVYVNGSEVDWVPSAGRTGCDEKFHTYLFEFVPETAGPLNLKVNDVYYPDNQGGVTAQVFEIGPPPPPPPTKELTDTLTDSPSPSDLTLVEEVRVDANNPNGASTLQPLVPGESYIFEAVGTVKWGLGDADAECATFDVDNTYLPARFASIHPHLLDVLVDGQGVEWVPTKPDVNGCNTEGHTYRHSLRATAADRVNFRFHETPGYYPDNQGAFTVRVFFAEGVPPDGTLVDQFTVPANAPSGVNSSASLSPSKRYRVAATGVYRLQSGPEINHDAECVQLGAGPFTRQDQLDDAGEMKDVYVNAREVDWVPSAGRTGCDEKFHAYLFEFVPETAGPLNLKIKDIYYPDNQSGVTAQVFEIGPPPPPGPTKAITDALSSPPNPSDVTVAEEVVVDSKNPNGATTLQPLIPGETYIFEVSGTYRWGLGKADGECATLDVEVTETWLRDRYAAVDPHIFDMEVDGQAVEWQATQPNPDGCNTTDHAYRLHYTATSPARVNFRINERKGYQADNDGSLTVRVFFAEGVPPGGTLVDEFTISSANSAGATSAVSLVAGERYRIVVAGVFTTPDFTHDAECVSVAGAPFTRQDQLDDSGEMKDVYVNGTEVDWTASAGRTGCDEKFHTYLLEVTATAAGPVNLKVKDFYYLDNRGTLSARIYEL